MNSRKQHERFLLERFIEAAAFDVQIVEERQAPDFIVRFERRSVGVGVTEIFNRYDPGQNPLQIHESISSLIVQRARGSYEASGAPPVHVSVCFGPGCDLRQLRMNEAATALASFVKSLNLAEWERTVWRPEGLNDPLPAEISYLQALRVPSQEMAHWVIARAGWVAPVAAEAIQHRVNGKAQRLQDYSTVVGENWLLVVADLTKPSQLMEARSGFDPRGISSPFSRAFFYRYPERKVLELGGRSDALD